MVSAVAGSKALQRLAADAFRAFVRSYAAHPASVKDVFHVKRLHLGHIAHSFCLRWGAPVGSQSDTLSSPMNCV
jgi:ATP-dependent RNA helicase DDX31/DBP7